MPPPPSGGGGVFVSITEQQTGSLEMKEAQWSQSKTSSAGDAAPQTAAGAETPPPHTHTGVSVCVEDVNKDYAKEIPSEQKLKVAS